MKVLIYELKSGDEKVVEAVDAKEYVASGGWSRSAPSKAKVKTRVRTPKNDIKEASKE